MIALVLVAALSYPEHILNRLAFGPRPGDVERIRRIGVDRWIEQQLHPERIDDRATQARIRMLDKHDERPIVDLTAQRIVRAAHSERQLDEVMADFWLNHFNVFAGKGPARLMLTAYEHEVIRPRIWGRFEELLLATAKSPAMLWYLDNARSRRGAINENYARELMELHTLGVNGGYTQKDVTELARVLTGWSINRDDQSFVFRRFLHDRDAKLVLGQRIAPNGGMEEGERMIRFLARHPSTARHIATKLAQRLVADDPPKALIDRVAKRFLDTRGDLRATVKAVIYDPIPIARELRKIGEPLYFSQPPTGYSDTADAWQGDGALMAKIDFAAALAAGKMPGVRVTTKNAEALAKMLSTPEFLRQ
jgi:uncharacterized protein (DUF1800 family)